MAQEVVLDLRCPPKVWLQRQTQDVSIAT